MATKNLKLKGELEKADNAYIKNIGRINPHFPPMLRAKSELLIWLKWQRQRYEILGYEDCIKICDEALKRNDL